MRYGYGSFREHQLRIAHIAIDNAIEIESLKHLGHFEYGNYCYANAKLGVHIQIWNQGITLDLEEFEKNAGNRLLRNIEAIVKKAQSLREEDVSGTNFLEVILEK